MLLSWEGDLESRLRDLLWHWLFHVSDLVIIMQTIGFYFWIMNDEGHWIAHDMRNTSLCLKQ